MRERPGGERSGTNNTSMSAPGGNSGDDVDVGVVMVAMVVW